MHKHYDSSFFATGEDGRTVMLVMRQHYEGKRTFGLKPVEWKQEPPEILTQDGRQVDVLNEEMSQFRIPGEKEVLHLD
ncbi:hypothetical protein H9C73_15895 [Marinobacterium sp. AK62]|uniref:Uncharacterized protein n=1 Tax=Marinobacterium alkalitolerans TaxID=1542925 RepID=A0ABS3ZGS8_9GAMM|nr:hypothetical protein [Marinobacterium alkalitolerans]MBP0050204.1 hypothetical protein [Marinobacterium alkalitolerans]